jgi:hypothetical protein
VPTKYEIGSKEAVMLNPEPQLATLNHAQFLKQKLPSFYSGFRESMNSDLQFANNLALKSSLKKMLIETEDPKVFSS